MALIKWAPFFEEPFEDMEKTFGRFMPSFPQTDKNIFSPAIDMYEDKNRVVVETQLAGVNPDDVEISIENGILSIKGESEKKSEVEEKDYYRKEIRRGSFYRSIQLPAHVVADKTEASSDDGVLKISIPKAPEAKSKKIKIETKGKRLPNNFIK